MALLRDSSEDLIALATNAAEYFGIPEASFVEKDYWVVELLRSVMRPLEIPPSPQGEARSARALFKGGTSLSKAFGIINRFSEDIDILIVHEGLGSSARENQVLRPICDRARIDLGLPEGQVEVREHTTGTSRNAHYRYPRQLASVSIADSVRLEMGVRGGTLPGTTTRVVDSYIAAYVRNVGVDANYDELVPVDVEVIAPVRTLAEKLALLHHAATTAAGGGDQRPLARAGRHFGDVARLLGEDDVQAALGESGSSMAELSADVDDWSGRAGWHFTPRPVDGYAASVAFDPAGEVRNIAEASYGDAMALMWGEILTFEECLEIIKASAGSL